MGMHLGASNISKLPMRCGQGSEPLLGLRELGLRPELLDRRGLGRGCSCFQVVPEREGAGSEQFYLSGPTLPLPQAKREIETRKPQEGGRGKEAKAQLQEAKTNVISIPLPPERASG